ncbi:hypothetical protein [Nocardiopsis sp. CC223A]|uniref:hypothetical protein n=1 Tax=Nocardiopsis sp. CC223A TaxID=3044051 RepID=UPI00278C5737|nr:hypothetical protein [Nocardiopsis sp. CC223A]
MSLDVHGLAAPPCEPLAPGEPTHAEPAFPQVRDELFARSAEHGFRSISLETARARWRSLAEGGGRPLVFIEVFCADPAGHRRLEVRERGIAGLPEPSWASAAARSTGFTDWRGPRLRLDSMRPPEENLRRALGHLGRPPADP